MNLPSRSKRSTAVVTYICCAGVTVHGPFGRHTACDIDWLIETNLRGVAQARRAFFPLLKQAEGAHVVNLSSMTAMFGTPTESPTRRQSSPSEGSVTRCVSNGRPTRSG